MVVTLPGLHSGTIELRPQDNARATLAPILKKEDGRIDFQHSAQQIYDRLRGFQPWPGAFTNFRGKGLQIRAARPVDRPVSQGALAIDTGRLFVGCGENTALELLELQPEGKKRMLSHDFIQGYRPQSQEGLR